MLFPPSIIFINKKYFFTTRMIFCLFLFRFIIKMKLLPIQLTPIQPGNTRNNDAPLHSPSSPATSTLLGQTSNGNANGIDHRLSLFNHSELIWRYGPLTFSSAAPPTYPPLDFKNHLPTNLGK